MFGRQQLPAGSLDAVAGSPAGQNITMKLKTVKIKLLPYPNKFDTFQMRVRFTLRMTFETFKMRTSLRMRMFAHGAHGESPNPANTIFGVRL